MKVFPPQNCPEIMNVYGPHISEGAVADYDWVAKNEFKGTVSSGAWMCYC